MKYTGIWVLLFLFAACKEKYVEESVPDPCETRYHVGVSKLSIEPTDETVSLALAGYANPYLGRFSLTWDDQGVLPNVMAMTRLNEEIYFIDVHGELSAISNADPKTARKLGNAGNIKHLAGFKGLLYGITDHGEILTCNPAQNLQWKEAGMFQNPTSFTASTENLYAATSDGILRMGTISGNDLEWTDIGFADDIISLTCDSRRLYATTANGWLLQRPLKRKDAEWVRIGFNNGETYTINVQQIVHVNEKLYALASNGRLYRSRHSTTGDLSARAMAIGDGVSTVVIVGVDVCGFDYSFTQSIKQEINRRKAIPVEAIMINASHTHFAPVTQKWTTWGKHSQLPDSLYLNLVRNGILHVIEEALDQMEPSCLFFDRTSTNIGYNRSLSGAFSVYDNYVDVVKVASTDGQTKSLIFLAACHPVFTDPTSGYFTMTANFPGVARTVVEETGVANAIFLQGCAGDINPVSTFRMSGTSLAGDVFQALNKKMNPINGNISFAMDSLHIPSRPWSKGQVEAFKTANAGTTGNVTADRNVFWADMMLDYYEKGDMPEVMPIYIQTFNIGDWKLTGLSREVTTEFSQAIRRRVWNDFRVSVAAYTNDVASYLSTDPHIRARNYEGYDSFFWYGQPSPFPEKVFDTVLEYIKTKNR